MQSPYFEIKILGKIAPKNTPTVPQKIGETTNVVLVQNVLTEIKRETVDGDEIDEYYTEEDRDRNRKLFRGVFEGALALVVESKKRAERHAPRDFSGFGGADDSSAVGKGFERVFTHVARDFLGTQLGFGEQCAEELSKQHGYKLK